MISMTIMCIKQLYLRIQIINLRQEEKSGGHITVLVWCDKPLNMLHRIKDCIN